jgi:DNA-binding transcriptional ArsR family regulator
MNQEHQNKEPEPVLPEDVPVEMPELPIRLRVHTAQQFKALGDPVRERIIAAIQYHPATAKQIADRLKIAPGTIGHHLQVLEAAGLVQVVARRLVHGIVAKYYTRTARIFSFDFSPEVAPDVSYILSFITRAREDLAEALASYGKEAMLTTGLPRTRLSVERAQYYENQIRTLIDEFLHEPIDRDGATYTLSLALFKAPPYQQGAASMGAAMQPGELQGTEQPQEEKHHDG